MNRILLWALVALFGLSAGLIVMGIALDKPTTPVHPDVPVTGATPSFSPYAPDDTGKPTPGAGTFCGGIAALPCPSGYACKYDGNYPDAGGTCQQTVVPPGTGGNPQTQCTARGGTWDATHRECTGIDQDQCAVAGGKFDECASACRHNPDKEAPCIMICVAVCSF